MRPSTKQLIRIFRRGPVPRHVSSSARRREFANRVRANIKAFGSKAYRSMTLRTNK